MPLVILSMSHRFADDIGISSESTSLHLERIINHLPQIIAPILTSNEHAVTEADIEVWPQILHPHARTKYHMALDIFTARDAEREVNCRERTEQISVGPRKFLPPLTHYCVDVHLATEGFASGWSS